MLRLDRNGTETAHVLTDRAGVASFDLPPTSGKVEDTDGDLLDRTTLEEAPFVGAAFAIRC